MEKERVIHRNINSSTIFIDDNDDAVLGDFELAAAFTKSALSKANHT